MGVMAKMASMQGLTPGIAVVTQKAAEMVYVIYSIVSSCVLSRPDSSGLTSVLAQSSLPPALRAAAARL